VFECVEHEREPVGIGLIGEREMGEDEVGHKCDLGRGCLYVELLYATAKHCESAAEIALTEERIRDLPAREADFCTKGVMKPCEGEE
jgi:hypothetical protein